MNQQTQSSNTATESPALLPPVDVSEDAEGITMQADLPGVPRDNLKLHVEGDTLTITAAATIDSLQGTDVVCTDDCGFVEARCDLPEGWEAATTIVYGETTEVEATCAVR